MENQTNPKRGLWLTSTLVLLSIAYPIQLIVGLLGFFLTSYFGIGILDSALYLLTGILGLYGTVLMWQYKLQGFYIFLGSVVLSMVSYYMVFNEISMYSLIIYACWILILSMNLKKFK